MVKLTKAQRKALKRKFDQSEVAAGSQGTRRWIHNDMQDASYRDFRKTVVPEMCGDGAVMVFWCGMWLGLETDGYTHS
jgi:hypothetical protein